MTALKSRITKMYFFSKPDDVFVQPVGFLAKIIKEIQAK